MPLFCPKKYSGIGTRHFVYLVRWRGLGLVFEGFSLFCDDRKELRMTFITQNS